jgi:hypothetical protein
MENKRKYGTDEYAATPTHCLPAFIGGKPTGYMCTKCGYLTKELDPIFDDLCLVCLKDWAIRMGVSRVIPTAEALDRDALEPTVKMEKSSSDATTILLNMREKETKVFGDGVKVSRGMPALEKIKKDV